MLVFIHAFEDIYQGLHGIEDFTIVDCQNIRDADDWGKELSYQVIESYIDPERDFDLEDPDDEDEINEAIDEDIAWSVYKIKDEYVTLGENRLNEIVFKELGIESFIKEYCEGIPNDFE